MTNAERKELSRELWELLAEMELWHSDPNASFEKIAEQFFRETGYMAPGKSVPLEMAYYQPDEKRKRAYETWHLERRAIRRRTIQRAAEALSE